MTILHLILKNIIKISITIFFQKIEIRHGENVPERGPVVFVANHPDSRMDARVMCAVTKRKVYYIAHAGLFANKLRAWLLRSCRVIPVYRPSGRSDEIERNIEAFQECYKVLERGEIIGVFPEGISDMPLFRFN